MAEKEHTEEKTMSEKIDFRTYVLQMLLQLYREIHEPTKLRHNLGGLDSCMFAYHDDTYTTEKEALIVEMETFKTERISFLKRNNAYSEGQVPEQEYLSRPLMEKWLQTISALLRRKELFPGEGSDYNFGGESDEI